METKRKKSILVPTDFSETCENAIRHAAKLAKSFEGSVYVLHVLNGENSLPTIAENKERSNEFQKSFFTDLESQAHDLITAIAKSHPEIDVIPVVREGDIFYTINIVAEELGVDLIILGTHGKKGLQRILGSYAMKVIDSTKIPVIVVQDDAVLEDYHTIVFPVNINEEDRQKAEYAVELAKETGAMIHIFPKVETQASNKAKLANVIRQLKAYFERYSVEYTVVENNMEESNFEDQIIAYSTKVSADLILILSDASSHFPLFGSKEEDLMFNDRQIPVMCVNERKFKSAKFSIVG